MKPGDFYLGVSEFFSIIVPGFSVTVVASLQFTDYVLSTPMNALTWSILAVASYIIGHILFALGSLWDESYDKFKPSGNESLLEKIGDIRKPYQNKDCEKINKYQWSKSVLSAKHPDGYQEVLRKEADSKLFRSLIIPLLLFSLFSGSNGEWLQTVLSLVFSILSYWRYREQRFKACKIAYTHIITLFALQEMKSAK